MPLNIRNLRASFKSVYYAPSAYTAMKAKTIPVLLRRPEDRSYEIIIQPGGSRRSPSGSHTHSRSRRVLCDGHDRGETVRRRFRRRMRKVGVSVTLLTIPPGERSKSLRVPSASTIPCSPWCASVQPGPRAGSGVVAISPGLSQPPVCGASSMFRSHNPPCASRQQCGGKVGINHRLGKNLIGSFHHPRAVVIDRVFSALCRCGVPQRAGRVVKVAAALDASCSGHWNRRSARSRRRMSCCWRG